jgi:hypothetical protein
MTQVHDQTLGNDQTHGQAPRSNETGTDWPCPPDKEQAIRHLIEGALLRHQAQQITKVSQQNTLSTHIFVRLD